MRFTTLSAGGLVRLLAPSGPVALTWKNSSCFFISTDWPLIDVAAAEHLGLVDLLDTGGLLIAG